MCDYHSILVTGDGKIFHSPTNSHIKMRVRFFPGINQKAWEVEYNPIENRDTCNLIQDRGIGIPPSVAVRAVERHYEKLVTMHKAIGDDRKLIPPFDGIDYSDVRQQLVKSSGWVPEQAGYDQHGYDAGGYDVDGYDVDGYDEDGYDAGGYDGLGLDVSGYDEDGYDVDGYDEYGYDAFGYNEDGEERR